MSLRSAGTFSPMLMVTRSPGTRSFACTFVWLPSRRTNTSEGSMPLIEAMTLDVEKSCHALKIACIRITMRSTTASARLAGAGLGSPRGFLQGVAWACTYITLQNKSNIPSNKANDTSSQQKTAESTENPSEHFKKHIALGGWNDIFSVLLETTMGLRFV